MTTAELHARDCAHLIHPLHNRKVQEKAHIWIKGEGAVLTNADGKEYIDGISGLWNVVAGHSRRELVEAASEQMKVLPFCSTFCGSSNQRAIELAERLAELCYPSINKFFFTSGGGEASESSFKTARYYYKMRGKPDKTKVISREWGYHGVTLAAMSATGISSYWSMFEPRVPGFIHIPSPYPYRYQAADGQSQGMAAANELENAILKEGPDTVAMFLAEPVQGAGGVIVPQDDYFARIREICDQYDVLLVADEVITAFGRTGKWFALDHWGIQPDIVQFAKGITSGYFPLGGIGVSDQIAEVIDADDNSIWMHAFTYSGHPVGCAVALRNIQILEEEKLADQSAEKGAWLLEALNTSLGNHPHVGDIRGKGLLCAVELVRDKATKAEFAIKDQVGIRVHAETQKRGLFSRIRGDIFCLAPPLITRQDQLESIVQILTESVKAVLG